MTSMDGYDRDQVIARPSPLACVECRRKHLKCNTSSPPCPRCSARGLKCLYTPSRRGCVGRARKWKNVTTPPSRSDRQPSDAMMVAPDELSTSEISSTRPVQSIAANSNTAPGEELQLNSQHSAALTNVNATCTAHDAYLADLFFTRFYPAHPILVSRSYRNEHVHSDSLRLVIQFIGSHYAPSIPSDPLRATAAAALEADTTVSIHLIQALLLYAIVLHARNELRDAAVVLDRAIDCAIELGLNRSESACYRSSSDPVIEEGMRRTWWELYITDGYLAALHRQASFRCDMIASSVLLPCEESAFMQGIIPIDQPSLIQLRERLFAAEEISFSSFCYRVEAVRIIGRLLAVAGSSEVSPDGVQAVDNAIASWRLHLPDSKAGILDDLGEVDQMMFQAHMLMNFASILLHFPRSELPLTRPNTSEIACATPLATVLPTSNQHAVKAIAASKEMCNLAALPIERYSPFFVCGLVFACMVQLSACSLHAGSSFEQHRDRVALMTGVLKSLGRNWEIANCALARLNPVAREVFHPYKESDEPSSTSSLDGGIDMTGMPSDINDMNWFDLFDSMQNQPFVDPEWMNL